ncbi:orotate phosphoribosyltransferase [Methylacidiphilum kamchatkense Kam1]|uniref:Orotate phosphoribosyltransferase n=1 Tax=Methylacidiphilum kamchatkense Kam1 TaxID=1202785 RepID=A0A0C1UN47_9BACT|nr:orotate phosphoribosyltransferase [Methylacidiphilum kamchatkense]KIE58029.1 orotate phosphoribosyltransferase [Methylacidiphilum kamchatkense Kam1]QDQ41664.1 orotate phosphoribosyltransferase [Methylacidiphilum kamchatkense Kam1]
MIVIDNTDPQAQNLLEDLIKSGALLEGHFLLRSGLHSRQFLQCALLLQNPSLCARYASCLAKRIHTFNPQTIVSAAIGGILIGHEIAKELGLRHIYAEKSTNGMTLRRFKLKPLERVVVVEDVITTGGTVKDILTLVREQQGVVCAVSSLVDRSTESLDFGVPYYALLKLHIDTFPPEKLPEDLKNTQAIRP